MKQKGEKERKEKEEDYSISKPEKFLLLSCQKTLLVFSDSEYQKF